MTESSVKYQKFAASQDEDDKTRSIHVEYKKILIVTVGFLLVAIVAVSVATGVGVGVSISQAVTGAEQEESGLDVSVVTKEKLEGWYCNPGRGIHFLSTINESGYYLSITTIEGKNIYIVIKSQNAPMTMMTLNDSYFLVIENYTSDGQMNRVDYIVPRANASNMEEMIEEYPHNTSDIMHMVETAGVREELHSCIEQLLMQSETVLIIEAALALGESGVTATEYPAALPFYMLALQISNAKVNIKRDLVHKAHNKGHPFSSRFIGTAYEGCPSQCTRCPYPQGTDECFGLCGPGCTCWEFVCGDCCLHQGCLEHDQCCEDNGYFSSSCFLPFGFDCEQGYSC